VTVGKANVKAQYLAHRYDGVLIVELELREEVQPFAPVASVAGDRPAAVGSTLAREVETLTLRRQLTLLLAEDNRVNQIVAKGLLLKLGHTLVIACNGKEALSLLEKQRLNLVLMDIQMPEMDGITATGIIRKGEQATFLHMPIIAMTAHAMK